jgi:hypothetical protein
MVHEVPAIRYTLLRAQHTQPLLALPFSNELLGVPARDEVHVSTNLGTILVGLGYDLSALEKGAPEAFRLVNSQTLGMSAEMKRASREGAESLRLIDEALGIHLSRPLTRLLTQEFPALATGLQSVLGVGAFGAISVAGIEFFDKISKGIEHAQKAEEEFANASRKARETFDESMASYAKSHKLRSLSGIDKKMFEIDYSAVEEARHKIDALAESMEKEAKASQEAASWWTKLLAAIGDEGHQLWSTSSTLGVEAISKQLEEFKRRFDDLSRTDALNGTREAAAAINTELATAKTKLDSMQGQFDFQQSSAGQRRVPGRGRVAEPAVISAEELAAQKEYFENLKKIQELQGAATKDQGGKEAEAWGEATVEAAKKAQSAVQQLYKEMGTSLAKLQPQTDPLKKLADEIRLMKQQADTDFRALGETAESALGMQAAMTALDAYDKRLDQVLAKAKREADVAEAAAKLPTRQAGPPNLSQLLNTTAPGMGPSATPIAPQLGSGGTAGAQLSVFNSDEGAQLKLAAQAYQEAMSPADHYKVAVGELNTLLQKGLIDQAAYTAAVQHAGDALEQAEKKIVHAKDGLRSFFAEMQQETNTGKFTFDILSQGMKGFEDQVAKIVTTGKANWREYFLSLEQSALKFFLNKEIMAGLKDLSGSGIGKSLGLGKLMGSAGGGSAALQAATQANTTALTTSTAALTPLPATITTNTAQLTGNTTAVTIETTAVGANTAALTALTTAVQELTNAMNMKDMPGGGGDVGGDDAWMGSLSDDSISASTVSGMAFASGSDYTPGGMALVGEEGPEMVNLPTGSSVTPNSQLRSSSPSIHLHIDAKGAEIGVEEKIARAISASAPQMIMRAVTASSEVQKRSLSRG